MRVTMLSWEYPPTVVGGLGRHVDALSRALTADGTEVDVVTRSAAGAAAQESVDKVDVLRATDDGLAIDFDTESLLAWAASQEHAMLRAALPRAVTHAPDVVHAHDWLVAHSAVTLAQVTGAPLVTTVHATESGRHRGLLTTPLRRAVDSVERWLVHQSDHVITCSTAMREEVSGRFGVPATRITVVPNGVDATAWRVPRTPRTPRTPRPDRSPSAGAPTVLFAGRIEWEKGVQTLVDALPALRRAHPGTMLRIAGDGSHRAELQALARRRRVASALVWLGRIDDAALAHEFATADVVAVPSLYEPFGLVALEAAAAGAPRVVSDVGGLVDLVRPGVSGTVAPAGDPAAWARALADVLADPVAARRLGATARREVARRYTWGAVATATSAVYAAALR